MRNRLPDIRKSFRVKQSDLAIILGVTKQTLCTIEKGHRDPQESKRFRNRELARLSGAYK